MQVLRQVEPPIDPGILLNWVREERFHSMFQTEINSLGLTASIGLSLNETLLTRAEARWLGSRWPRRHQDHAVVRMDAVSQGRYIIDDFGRFIQELLQEKQLLEPELPDALATPLLVAAKVWPTGFCVYIAMMRLCQTALGSEVMDLGDLPAVVLDPTTWQSIHENVMEDINTARPFLAYLLAITPVWQDWTLNTIDNRGIC